MNNSTKHDVSVEKSTTSNRIGVRFAMLHIPLAGALSVIMGCLPSTPPSVAQIFSPSPGFFFPQATGDVSANGLTGAVCYTTDGSFPSYNGGTCSGGTTKTYAGNIELACEAGETGTAQKTATIVYAFNGAQTSSAASYSLLCSVASNVKVFSVLGAGTISGQYPGNISVTGSAALNTDTGVLNFNFTTTSDTGYTNITSEESGTIEGVWGEPVMTSPVGVTSTSTCTDSGLAPGCGSVPLDTPRDMGITDASKPIDFDLSLGGETTFSIYVARLPPEIPPIAEWADTYIDYTLTTTIVGAGSETTWYRDADGDGHGDLDVTTDDVLKPNGYVANTTDCDDDDGSRYPGNPEVCDLVDNDCDGVVPAGEADNDADHFLACDGFVSSSDASVLGGSDCNDAVAGINPGVTETADLVDQDCDGEVDNGFKYIFVTSERTDGRLSFYDTNAGPDQDSPGLEGADEFCQTYADGLTSVVPTGTYKAWLSSPTLSGSIVNAVDRMSDIGLPYVNVDGSQIAANLSDLLSSNNVITFHESKTPVDADSNPQIWTGTSSAGLLKQYNKHCNAWTNNASTPVEGSTGFSGFPIYWTYWAFQGCDQEYFLYCVQQ